MPPLEHTTETEPAAAETEPSRQVEPQEDDAPPDGKSLRDHATGGFVWLFGQTVVSRLATFASQVTLAWILDPTAFGTVGLAYSVMAFAGVFQGTTVGKVLVAEQRRFGLLANSAFWLSIALGLGTGLLVVLAAPVAGRVFDSEALPHLLWILAAALPFQSIRTVPDAALSKQLRFGDLAKLNVLDLVGLHGLTVVLALLGFGVYSFVLPLLLTAPLVTGLYFYVSGVRPGAFDRSHWGTLFLPSGQLILSALLSKVTSYGDYLLLGAAYTEAEVGLYYVAFTLSSQAVMLVVSNLNRMLFPVLSQLRDEPKRQREAFVRVCKVGAALAVPASLYIAFHAEPIIRLLYEPQWLPAVPLLAVLALASVGDVVAGAGWACISARGEFGLVLSKNFVQSVLFAAFVACALPFGLVYVALAVTIARLLTAAYISMLVLGTWRKGVALLLKTVEAPVMGGVLAGALSLGLGALLPETRLFALLRLAAGALLFLVVGGGVLRLRSAAIFEEVRGLTMSTWKKMSRRVTA